ncbi:MAG TPA: ATP-grasp domain-containing protein [Nanoarchaeota archaeon]|nr:MAG: hypothetical protein QT01_C0007G0024 [archaeon GW2011_AR6]HIH18091.1 ATP-grasp domain-containing protein [Nanoarchaeota archaeon]HIH34018.1 ATP-grasp domain-containing protein [Nanoarchaeota archaeon]HIH66199.1 ATP-grasp domain-containing protein [Nanoarchaeota archaeon]
MTEHEDLVKAINGNMSDSIFFAKYPELVNGKDVGENPRFPFTEGGYDEQTIVAETMRFYSVAAMTGAKFLLPIQAPLEQVHNLHEKLGIPFDDSGVILFDNNDPTSYTSTLNSLPKGSLHLLHPYNTINEDVCAINPRLLSYLNNKANLREIVEISPKRKLITVDELLRKDNEIMKKPFVVKKTTGSSGDGVRILNSADELPSLDGFLNNETDIILEEFVDSAKNYGIQYFIGKDKRARFVGFNFQKTTESGEFEGSVCCLSEKPDEGLVEVGFKACKNIAALGYWGFVGLDVLQNKAGDYYVIDPNIRATAATPVYLLRNTLKDTLGDYVYVSSAKMMAGSAQQVINEIENQGGMLLSMSHGGKGVYKYFAMFGADEPDKAISKFAQKNS